MVLPVSTFPTTSWDGLTKRKDRRDTFVGPGPEEFDELSTEIIAIQDYLNSFITRVNTHDAELFILELEEDVLVTGAVTDGNSASLVLDPAYNATSAQTVTRHNYIELEDVVGGANVTITNACAMRFNAALGTHKATTALDKTALAKDGTIKINVNGTIHHIQLYADA